MPEEEGKQGAENLTDTPDVTTLSREKINELKKTDFEEEGEKKPDEKKPDEKPKEQPGAKETEEEKKAREAKEAAAQAGADTISKADFESLKSEHEKLRTRWENQEKLIQRFGNEVGLMRKMSPDDVQRRLQGIRDLYNPDSDSYDPIKGEEELRRFRADQAEEKRKEEVAGLIQKISSTKEAVKQFIPEFESTLEDLAGLIKEDGAGDEFVKAFRENPYLLDHTTLFNMHKRASLSKENTALKGEVEKLKAEIEALKRKPDDMVKKIEDAAKFKQEGARTGGAAPSAALYEGKLPHQMSRDEIKQFLKSGGK